PVFVTRAVADPSRESLHHQSTGWPTGSRCGRQRSIRARPPLQDSSPGDAYAPGASITWLTAYDARTGVEQGRVDFPDCVAARIFVASDGAAYVMCRDQLYAIDTTTWSVAQALPFSGSVGPVGIVGDRTIYGVTRELEVSAMNLKTGETTRIGKSNGTGATAQAWGELTIAPSGSTVWVISKASGDRAEYDPDTLAIVSLNT